MMWIGVAGLILLGRRRVLPWDTRKWTWPVPTLFPPGEDVAYPAKVSDGVGSKRGAGTHHGCDIMYRRRNATDRIDICPPGVVQADGGTSTPHYFAPMSTPIVAAADGLVWSVGRRTDGGGISVVLDHGKPWATYYTHLHETQLPDTKRGKRSDGGASVSVKAGDVIGYMGASAKDGEHIRHLHFEVWYGGAADHYVDPQPALEDAAVFRRTAWRPTTL